MTNYVKARYYAMFQVERFDKIKILIYITKLFNVDLSKRKDSGCAIVDNTFISKIYFL